MGGNGRKRENRENIEYIYIYCECVWVPSPYVDELMNNTCAHVLPHSIEY